MRSWFGILLSASCAFWAQTPSTGPNWSGSYSGGGVDLELRQASPGAFDGSIRFDGKTFPATAQASGNSLKGRFTADSASFTFEATITDGIVSFATGGTTYVLRKLGTDATARPAAIPPGALFRHSLGFSLRLPNGWTANENAEGATLLPSGVSFVASRQDNPEIYIAVMRDDYNPQEESQTVAQFSAAVARNGAASGRNGQRESASFGQRQGSIYRWDVRDPRSNRLAALDVYLAPEGQKAFVLVAAGEESRVRARDPELRQILSSMAAVQIQQSSGAALGDSTPLAQRWLAKLRGKHVRQFWASQGMSSDRRHILSSDGSYSYHSSSMVSADVPGASALSTGGDNTRGRWRIRDVGGQPFLEVQYANGKISRMPIAENGQNWFLNGEKAFAVDPE